ncbi:AAA family ATPase [Desulfobacter latus]|uniref:AAA family ATPase n=1 Tax=Desulfobacter latus TaxID=2292 RepID=A0A850T2L0_9BACT|nr:AAA family ATPase [Desulfobacter latus]NWH05341.1 AAA family ATPase [Desulfobacter latus]
MLQKLYINNFRCLENFELKINTASTLLIGKNGTGKSTVASAFQIFQNIGRGINRLGNLIKKKDFSHGRIDLPMRLEIEVFLSQDLYSYILAIELPENFREPRILEEELKVNDRSIFSRNIAQVNLLDNTTNHQSNFMVDWHLVALPVIQKQSEQDPLYIFENWLAHMIILAPIPSIMAGESENQTLMPERDTKNFGEWFTGILSMYPAAYMLIDTYLKKRMPDLLDFQNEQTGKNHKSMNVRFKEKSAKMTIPFNDLSDGEKCFFLSAVVLAANESYGPLFCFWDEPDNYLSLSEVGHFLIALRKSFEKGGQLFATSHNSEAIQKFSEKNTLLFYRKSHFEPTRVKLVDELSVKDDLLTALICDDLEP